MRFGPGLADADRERVRSELLILAGRRPGRGGKALKTLRGTEGDFHRLRVGDWRVMYEVIPEDRVLLVLGIVNRKDLEQWIRRQRRT
jgi:mRNA-degrading endonuclease RelE of RelBE toxin-antitoxin system